MLLQRCKDSLIKHNVNPASTIEYEVNGSFYTLTLEQITAEFLKTQKKEFFINLFEKVIKSTPSDIEEFFQQMGQLILMSSLSDKEI